MATITNRQTAAAPDATSVNAYKDQWGVHEYYVVTLEVKGDDSLRLPAGKTVFAISGTLDETFSVRMGSQWDSPYNKSFSSMAGESANKFVRGAGAIGDLMKNLAGIETRSRMASAQMWMSSDPISFNLPFTFVAQNSAATDVRDKVLNLMKLTAPSQINGVTLRAPGPTIGSQILGAATDNFQGRRISLYVGNLMTLDNCIIKSVECQFDSRLDSTGIPISAKVTVDVESYFSCFTVQDLDALFKQPVQMGTK